MNTFSLILLGFALPATAFVWLTATRRRAAKPVHPPPAFGRCQEPERSAFNLKSIARGISETKRPVPMDLPGAGWHILFVDDECHFAENGRSALKQLGYQVTLVADANEALSAIRGTPEKIDCVVTDLSMPGMSGFDLARLCQRLLPGVPVILMSGHDGTIAAELLRACGIHGLLLKPFTHQTLGDAVQRVLTGGKDLN